MTTPYSDPQAVHTPSTGGSPPAAWGQAVRDDLQFHNTWVGCFAQVPYGTLMPDDLTTRTYINFNGADFWDSDNFHNPLSNPSRFTIPAGLGGKYMIGFQMVTSQPSPGTLPRNFQGVIRVDGATEYFVVGGTVTPLLASFSWTIRGEFPLSLNAGQYFEIGTSQQTITAGSSPQYIDFGYCWVRYMGA